MYSTINKAIAKYHKHIFRKILPPAQFFCEKIAAERLNDQIIKGFLLLLPFSSCWALKASSQDYSIMKLMHPACSFSQIAYGNLWHPMAVKRGAEFSTSCWQSISVSSAFLYHKIYWTYLNLYKVLGLLSQLCTESWAPSLGYPGSRTKPSQNF